VAYAVDSTRVDTEVAAFADHLLRSWNACLGEIARDPHPRFGTYVDRVIPILGFPMRSWIYEIAAEANRVSGETVFVFTGDFFPEYAPVYVVNEGASTVIVLYLRENRRS
jgi:hypothetical protein